MFKLVIQDDEGKTTVVPLIRDEITIGRKEGNTIRLTERNVSRRHARILRNAGEVQIEDLGSYNGIRVNNARIAERVSLRVSDQVQIGDYKLYLKAEGVEQVDDARTMPIERVDTRAGDLAGAPTDIVTAVGPTAPLTAQTGAVAGSATTPMAVPPPPTPVAAPQLVGNPARTLVAIADTDPQGRPVATAATVAALTAPAAYGKLVVLSSNFAGQEFELTRPQMIIGRTDENDIVVNHRSISRNHAKLVREPDTGRYTISDLQSSNGVRVNGQDYGKVELRRGDVVDLGHVRLRFIEPGEDFVFARDAVVTDVPDASNKRGMMVAVVLAILLLGGAGVFFVLRDKGDNAVANPQGKLDADAPLLVGNDPALADAAMPQVEPPDAPRIAETTGNDEADKITIQCLDHQMNANWDQLAACGADLAKVGDKRADDFKGIATREKAAKAGLARLGSAVTGGKLRIAREELDKISKDSQYAKAAREQVAKAEDDFVRTATATARGRVDKACRGHAAYLTSIEREHGKPLADRVRAGAPCTPEQPAVVVRDPNAGTKDPNPGTKDPTPCDFEALKSKGLAYFGKGQYGGALSAFEDAIQCSPQPQMYTMAASSACKAGRTAEAKRFYAKVPGASRPNVQQTCLQNGIQLGI